MPRKNTPIRELFVCVEVGSAPGARGRKHKCLRCGWELAENATRFAKHIARCPEATDEDKGVALEHLNALHPTDREVVNTSAAFTKAFALDGRARIRALFEDTNTRRNGEKAKLFRCIRCGHETTENATRFAQHILKACKHANSEDRSIASEHEQLTQKRRELRNGKLGLQADSGQASNPGVVSGGENPETPPQDGIDLSIQTDVCSEDKSHVSSRTQVGCSPQAFTGSSGSLSPTVSTEDVVDMQKELEDIQLFVSGLTSGDSGFDKQLVPSLDDAVPGVLSSADIMDLSAGLDALSSAGPSVAISGISSDYATPHLAQSPSPEQATVFPPEDICLTDFGILSDTQEDSTGLLRGMKSELESMTFETPSLPEGCSSGYGNMQITLSACTKRQRTSDSLSCTPAAVVAVDSSEYAEFLNWKFRNPPYIRPARTLASNKCMWQSLHGFYVEYAKSCARCYCSYAAGVGPPATAKMISSQIYEDLNKLHSVYRTMVMCCTNEHLQALRLAVWENKDKVTNMVQAAMDVANDVVRDGLPITLQRRAKLLPSMTVPEQAAYHGLEKAFSLLCLDEEGKEQSSAVEQLVQLQHETAKSGPEFMSFVLQSRATPRQLDSLLSPVDNEGFQPTDEDTELFNKWNHKYLEILTDLAKDPRASTATAAYMYEYYTRMGWDLCMVL